MAVAGPCRETSPLRSIDRSSLARRHRRRPGLPTSRLQRRLRVHFARWQATSHSYSSHSAFSGSASLACRCWRALRAMRLPSLWVGARASNSRRATRADFTAS